MCPPAFFVGVKESWIKLDPSASQCTWEALYASQVLFLWFLKEVGGFVPHGNLLCCAVRCSLIGIGEYFFGSPNLLYVSPFYLFSSLKLSLHRFCSPTHCFYSEYHRSSFSSVARSGCSLIHWINSFITKITQRLVWIRQLGRYLPMHFGAWIPNNFQKDRSAFSVFTPDQAPRQKWRYLGINQGAWKGWNFTTYTYLWSRAGPFLI